MNEDLGVSVEVFGICRHCGVPVSREIDTEGVPAMDAWVDITLGDACSEANVHEVASTPQPGAALVFVTDHQVNMARRIRAGRECTFLYEVPDESGDWYVNVPGENGSLTSVVKVHPNEVKEVGA